MNNKGCEKNNRGKERADEIVKLFCCIANTKENRRVKEYFERSNIYQEIQTGNEVFLYDSLAANLLEITTELRKGYGDCLGSQYITVDSISDYYKKQLGEKKCLAMKRAAKAELPDVIQETLFLNAIPGMAESIIEGGNIPFEDCLTEEEVEW